MLLLRTPSRPNMSTTSKIDPDISTQICAVRRERETRQCYLEKTEDEGFKARIVLDRKEIFIGRAEEADIRVTSRQVSRKHAILSRRGTDYVIRDNESDNGVFLNGVKIHSAVLRDGDVLQIADRSFVFCES
jgi:hypothetical protein